jgi:hypothetical protein
MVLYDGPARRDGETVRSPFPAWYFERLERMAEFTLHATKPDGTVAQIGDNDSGRFFKLSPAHRCLNGDEAMRLYPALEIRGDPPDPYWDETILDHRALVAAINALFGRDDFARFHGTAGHADALVVERLARGARLPSQGPPGASPKAVGRHITGAPPEASETTAPPAAADIRIPLPDAGILDGLRSIAYPDFGLYLWRSARFFLSVRCGPVGQQGRGGHAHNDQLAIELWIDGTDWLRDPGSGLYTPDLAARNAYRSVNAHATPRLVPGEPSSLGLGAFRLEDTAQAACHRFDAEGFLGSHQGYGDRITREIVLTRNEIILRDRTGKSDPASAPPLETVTLASPEEAKRYFGLTVPFSPGYGKISKAL